MPSQPRSHPATTLPAPAVNEKADLAVQPSAPGAHWCWPGASVDQKGFAGGGADASHALARTVASLPTASGFVSVENSPGLSVSKVVPPLEMPVPTTAFHSFATCCVSVPSGLMPSSSFACCTAPGTVGAERPRVVARWSIWDSMRRGVDGQSVVFKSSRRGAPSEAVFSNAGNLK